MWKEESLALSQGEEGEMMKEPPQGEIPLKIQKT